MRSKFPIKPSLLVVSCLLFVTMLFSAGCGDKKPVKIGVFEPLTGRHALNGSIEKEGIELAHSQRSVLGDQEVQLVYADNQSDPNIAVTAAETLVKEQKVNAVIGSWGSTLSIAAGDVFQENQTMAVAASCTNPLVTHDNDWYVRMCYIDSFQGRALARYTVERLGARSVAIITESDSSYSTSLARYYSEALMELTANPHIIVATESYASDTQDFNTLITSISRLSPDLIFAPGNAKQSALLIKQARQLGVQTPFLGGDTWANYDFIQTGGEAVENVIISSFFDLDANLTSKTQPFIQAYQAAYGKNPADIAALSYDAYNLLLDAMEISGTKDPEKLQKTIYQMQGWEGVTGHFSFDVDGNPIKDVVFKTVKNGELSFLESISGATTPPARNNADSQ